MKKFPKNTEFEWAVGALVAVEIDDKKYIILQKRAADDSFPGCLQVTVHGWLEKSGKIKEGTNRAERESMIVALRREVSEEVSEMIGRSQFYGQPILSDDFNELQSLIDASTIPGCFFTGGKILSVSRKMTQKLDKPTVKKTDVTIGFEIPWNVDQINSDLIPAIKQLQSDGVVVLLSVDDLDKLIPLDSKLHKKNGVTESGKYGMFQDEIDAVKKVFEQDGYRFVIRDWKTHDIQRITGDKMNKLWQKWGVKDK